MKKFLAGGFVVLIVIAMVLGAFVGIGVRSHDRELAMLTAPTLEELDALSERLAEAEPQESPEVTKPQDEADTDSLIVESSALPTRLASTPSPEKLEERFTEKRPDQIREVQVTEALMKMLEGALSIVSEKEAAGWAWERSQELMALGKWDEARRCFWKVLDTPLDPFYHRWASAQLAWLEEDPEVAVRYLELSIQGDERGYWLSNAVRLSQTTGSNALAEHYLAQLRIQDPETARRFEAE